MRRLGVVVGLVLAIALSVPAPVQAQSVPPLPPPPAIPYPNLPPEAAPVLRALSPMVGIPCGTVGLAVVVVAIASAAAPISAGSIFSYMTPLFVVCGQFPPIAERFTCEMDKSVARPPVPGAPQAPVAPPAAVGPVVDQVDTTEVMIEESAGQSLPASPTATVADPLGCVKSSNIRD